MSKPSILVIEDDDKVRKFIVSTLKFEDYRILEASTGNQGIILMNTHNPDVILLDLGLPDIDGKEVVKTIRKVSQVPIIILSARFEDSDKVEVLDYGADDYLTKPFSVEELLARLRVVFRRRKQSINNERFLKNRGLLLDLDSGIVSVNGTEMHTTPIEYKLLVLLMSNQDKILTYNVILKEVWGLYSDNIPALRVFVATLRRKIETLDPDGSYIQTHVGLGYRMVKNEEV